MSAGISGSLIPPGFLSDVFPTAFAAQLAEARRSVPSASLVRWWRRVTRQLGPASGSRAVFDVAALPLADLLGYQLQRSEPAGNAQIGVLSAQDTRVVLLVVPWAAQPVQAWRDVQRAARVAGARWALAVTGASLHVLDATRTWSRRSLEFNLEHVMVNDRSVLILWMLAGAGAMASTLEDVIQSADAHGAQVCSSLGDGVLASLGALVGALHGRRRTVACDPYSSFDQALTLVYRVLFLLFAEARGVVPTWHHVYRDAYSIDAICRRSLESARPAGLWEAMQAISRLAHAGCRAGDLKVTAFNGRLFSPRHAPLVTHGRIPDKVVREAVLWLATGPTPTGRRRIAYADLGVEQLGAVYERVLEYEPAAIGRSTVVLTRTSRERKSTGSFYTPRCITEFLVRRTLQPLVHERTPEEILSLRVVDPAMGSGAFLVAACRFLARAVERARLTSGEWHPDDVGHEQRSHLRRVVAQRCLYGVDLNPTAVQLARLSLWLTTLANDRPLSFLDHNLATGDSLIGASLDDIAHRSPLARERGRGLPVALPLFDGTAEAEMATAVLPDRYRIAQEPDDSADAVRQKERVLNDLGAPGTPLHRWKSAADLWCAGVLWPDRTLTQGLYSELLSRVLAGAGALPERQAGDLLERARSIARERQVFHWQLEFPEVFFAPDGRPRGDGGFDAVLGNPPWDVLRSDSGAPESRDRDRATQRERLRFFRSAGVYRLQSSGHANRYQLFVERALHVLRPGGRLGLLLPSGFATDHGSAALRRGLLDRCRVDRLFGFRNRDAIFPIHRDMRFLVLTASEGPRTERIVCRFGLRDAAWLDTLPDDSRDDGTDARPIVLSRALLEACDPDRLSIPELADSRDLNILSQILVTVPKLGEAGGWGAKFGRELNATDDREHFSQRTSRSAGALPVIEGKQLEPFRTRTERTSHAISRASASWLLDPASTFERRRLAYRDVASATNRLTLIASLLPAGTVSTHTVFCLKTALDEADQYCLMALLNSLVANYLVRLQMTTHVTASLMARLPVPVPDSASHERRALVACARQLETVGIDGGIETYAELNALAARLYGLSRHQYDHVVSTFPLLSSEVRDRCRKHGGTET